MLINTGTNNIYVEINQAGATQYITSPADSIIAGSYYLVVFSRQGAVGRLYLQGIDATFYADDIIDPLTSARDLHIGIDDAETADLAFDGILWRPRIWGKTLSAKEVRFIFETERNLFGV
jgi:hypothetical protein